MKQVHDIKYVSLRKSLPKTFYEIFNQKHFRILYINEVKKVIYAAYLKLPL
jgi:hypothetical protein